AFTDARTVANDAPETAGVLRGPWRAAAVYVLGGAAYACVMSVPWTVFTADTGTGPVKLAMFFWTYLWPAVIATGIVACTTRTARLKLLGAYAGVFALLAAAALARSPDLRWYEPAAFWVVTNGLETALLFLFLARPIRAVGPLVVTFAVLALGGGVLAPNVIGASDATMRAAAAAGELLNFGVVEVFGYTIALGLALFAAGGWFVLRRLGRRYQRKRLSDESLTIDTVFLFFGIAQSVSFAFEGATWAATGLAAFLAYKLVTIVAFAVLRRRPVPAPRRLLLLRVFALGARSERFFDVLRKHWLRLGSVSMIAGPDLVTSTVEPHEFLEFASGELAGRFVTGRPDLERRIAAIDRARDPDGRYRVNEFFCHADTWQMTMHRLVEESDVVLMDLRSFSPANRGCVHELGELLEAIDLARVVFVVDRTTDRGFLETTLRVLWSAVGPGSPNRRASAPTARLLAVERSTAAEIRGLMATLLDAVAPRPARAADAATPAPHVALGR
ncbi:MAG TPA: hypothetical protein VFN70_13865, partial [Burkholderiales bacterium]|nr:hypothetical protein [Burkholderiales bacterium]